MGQRARRLQRLRLSVRNVTWRTDCEPCLGHSQAPPFIFLVLGEQRGVLAMAEENEVKQVQEPAQEQQQQQSTEPTEPPPPEVQVAETQAPEAAGASSENPNP